MKTQLNKPARERARYTDQYKQEALELWRRSGRSAAKVAAELGIRPPLLYRWAQTERVSDPPKPGHKPRRSGEFRGQAANLDSKRSGRHRPRRRSRLKRNAKRASNACGGAIRDY